MTKIAKLLTSALLLTLLISVVAMGATTTIDFETENSGYTASATEGSGTTDVFNRVNTSYGGNATFYWACEDISLVNPNITLSPIDISSQSTFSFSIDFFTKNANDWDDNDELLITYSVDGGADQNLMWVQNTGEQYNDPAALDLDFDGNGDIGQELPANSDPENKVDGTTFETFTKDNVSISGTSLVIKLQFNGLTATDESIYLDNIVITTAAGSSPVITVSETSLSGFSYVEGSGPSYEQSYTVSGSDLTANITVTPPTNYEISTGTGGSFIATNPITLTQLSGSIAATTIYTRLKAGLSAGSYDVETISATSTGAVTKNTTLNGNVWKTEPASHITDFSADSKTSTSVTLSWTDPNTPDADGYIVTATGDIPVDEIDIVNADSVQNVSGTSATVTGLDPETAYTFKIYPYNNSGEAIDYKTDGVVPSVSETTDALPTGSGVYISEYADAANYAGEYVEIYNSTNSAVNVSSYVLRQIGSTQSFTIPASTSIPAKGFLIVARNMDQAAFETEWSVSLAANVVFVNSENACPQINGDEQYLFEDATGTNIDPIADNEYTNQQLSSGQRAWRTGEGNTASDWNMNAISNATPGTHDIEQPLAVELAAFTAKAKAGVIELAWETASETNNANFVIYRNNEVLATVEGAGTTSETNNYVYTDASVVPGVAYTYVLADVDYANEETKYADKAVTVTLANDVVEADFVIGAAYPNPFNPTAVVPVELSREAVVNAKVYTLTGREIATLANGTMNAGSHELKITANNMTTGLYLVKIMVEDVVDVQKIAFVK